MWNGVRTATRTGLGVAAWSGPTSRRCSLYFYIESFLATRSDGDPSASSGESVPEAPRFVAGLDDVRPVGDPVDDGLGQPWVRKDLRLLAEGQVGGHDQ